MPDEDWRDEIQEYALLLDAVASGDRSRVVKHLTDYILGKKEGNQASQLNDQEPQGEEGGYPEEEENGYEYYEEDAYNDPYAGTSTQSADQEGMYTGEGRDLDYEDGQYQYDNDYDENIPTEYGVSGAAETYYEGPYMSGAYNEPENGVDTYDGEPYDDYSGLDPSAYGNETYTMGEPESADMSYALGTYDGSNSNSYGTHSYPEGQQYGGEYYDQAVDGTYNDWNQGGENYHYQHSADEVGGEWHQESDHGLVSDDQIQEVVDEAALNEPGEEYFEEDQMHPRDDRTRPEEQARPNDDDVPPSYHSEQTNLHQPYPEDALPFYPPTKDTPPEYSAVPRYEVNHTQQTQYAHTRLNELTGVDRDIRETEIPVKSHGDRFGAGNNADLVDFEEDEWEDEACEEEDESIGPPPSPTHSDLHFNPFSHQYGRGMPGRRPDPFLYLPTIESSQPNVVWERNRR
ncbi:hypothetical protein CLAIMM_02525 [Cladophialophora immunda]|nr:hypothetical protein CLAIMM_02525 [Cladophialophora immunda]